LERDQRKNLFDRSAAAGIFLRENLAGFRARKKNDKSYQESMRGAGICIASISERGLITELAAFEFGFRLTFKSSSITDAEKLFAERTMQIGFNARLGPPPSGNFPNLALALPPRRGLLYGRAGHAGLLAVNSRLPPRRGKCHYIQAPGFGG
jgi:hypothetical protein